MDYFLVCEAVERAELNGAILIPVSVTLPDGVISPCEETTSPLSPLILKHEFSPFSARLVHFSG
jgi:hypothetical protein